MVTIERLTAETANIYLDDLVALLQNCVDAGASIGFLPPLSDEEAAAYWQSREAVIRAGAGIALVARWENQLVGSVQLGLELRANGNHRAEVQKLMVHTDFRRRGIASALMDAIEAAARQHQRTLLVLDTRRGDPSEQLYLERGYTRAGIIPHYAINADGSFSDTTFYYRLLAPAGSG